MHRRKLLVLGGYGGKNVGDDAQLEGALIDLRSSLENANIVVLTPNPAQTTRLHGKIAVGLAPRVSFYDFDKDARRYTRFEAPANRDWLITRSEEIYKEAVRYSTGQKHGLSARQLTLVEEIANAGLIYYAGGGYMMGPTASRLWDAMLVCRIAKLFSTPVVMSGQNVGVWQSTYDREAAAEGFSSVAIIATRDDTFSKAALAEIGIEGEHIFATHDDAFFVPASPKTKVDSLLTAAGLPQGKSFITLSLHLSRGSMEILTAVRSITDLPIVIVPTCPPDLKPQGELYAAAQAAGLPDIYLVKKVHGFQDVKGIIGSAHACVSSRHHPIIFALSHGVPCISLNFSDYFNAKNFGAMQLCDVGEFSLNVSRPKKTGLQLRKPLKALLRDHAEISTRILNSHTRLNRAKHRFMTRVREIWQDGAMRPTTGKATGISSRLRSAFSSLSIRKMFPG